MLLYPEGYEDIISYYVSIMDKDGWVKSTAKLKTTDSGLCICICITTQIHSAPAQILQVMVWLEYYTLRAEKLQEQSEFFKISFPTFRKWYIFSFRLQDM